MISRLESIILSTSYVGGVIGASMMEYLRGANSFVIEFGYAAIVVTTVILGILKALEIYMRWKDRKDGRNKH